MRTVSTVRTFRIQNSTSPRRNGCTPCMVKLVRIGTVSDSSLEMSHGECAIADTDEEVLSSAAWWDEQDQPDLDFSDEATY